MSLHQKEGNSYNRSVGEFKLHTYTMKWPQKAPWKVYVNFEHLCTARSAHTKQEWLAVQTMKVPLKPILVTDKWWPFFFPTTCLYALLSAVAVCNSCALATSVSWLRHWPNKLAFCFSSMRLLTVCAHGHPWIDDPLYTANTVVWLVRMA